MSDNLKDIIRLQEHQPFVNPKGWGNGRDYSDKMEYLVGLGLKFEEPDFLKEPKYLGICNWTASYYIGAAWLVEKELAVVVTPKMKNIDFVEMFLAALKIDTQKESNYFAKCYGIQFDEPSIETNEELNQLTPLLVLHFLSLLERLVKRGLKKGYILHEENLKAKVKGRVLFGKHLKTNVFQQRTDRVYCQYQEYTEDIPENRLLKKALLFSERVISRCDSLKRQSEYSKIQSRFNKLKYTFSHISDEIELYQVQKISLNKLFKDYKEAMKVAKMILCRFDYSIREAGSEQQTTPPFWIDMARLYEMWVWGQLQKNSACPVLFQEVGSHGRQVADFVIKEENMILDAKYKPNYSNDNWVDIDDIRELSGNARDERLLPNLPEDYSPRCIILYPGETEELRPESEVLFECQGQKIPHYRNFYKISVPLPIFENGR